MLEKVISIENIGVIRNGVPNALNLDKVTLIYSDNARGKSTFASLMNACASSNSTELIKRKTIGAKTDQKVIFRFKAPSGDFNAEFNGKAWAGGSPNLQVFNQDFVERNVYTNAGVTPDQRASLLELALGDAAVTQRSEFQKQTEIQRAIAIKVSAAEATLTGYRGALTVDQFIALPEIKDVDAQIQSLDKQIADANGSVQMLSKPEFKEITSPQFDLEEFKTLMVTKFEQLQDGAEELVKKHFSEHIGAETERWVSEGLLHKPEPNCPFCGQETQGLELLSAYKVYFNQAYKEHLSKVQTMKSLVTECIPSSSLSNWNGIFAFNNGALGSWVGILDFTLPSVDMKQSQVIIEQTQQLLLKIAEQKIAKPLDAIPVESIKDALDKLNTLSSLVEDFNAKIQVINQEIADFKNTLAASDLHALSSKKTKLLLHKVSHETKVRQFIKNIESARADYKVAETAKNDAKAKLEGLMATLLSEFQKSINEWLVRFGAQFSIQQLEHTYLGGGVRGQYVIEVRGAKVNVGPGAPGELSFHEALSEGDKRTLAFAFFLAKLFANPNLANTTVVLDDVFTSLDHHRRHNTADAVVKMAQECSQVIALGHDAHFLRELRKRVKRKQVCNTLELCLHRDVDNYSLLREFDLDEFCASDYYKNYIITEQFVTGALSPEKLLDAAKAIRPLIEGHLHRCFPKRFKDGQTVGEMLDIVRNANGHNPLVALQPTLGNLVTLNDFAAAYHHDTSGGHPRTDINDAELMHFATGALKFIQSGKLW